MVDCKTHHSLIARASKYTASKAPATTSAARKARIRHSSSRVLRFTISGWRAAKLWFTQNSTFLLPYSPYDGRTVQSSSWQHGHFRLLCLAVVRGTAEQHGSKHNRAHTTFQC
ncbi:unnamed protein product [Ectocarpus fasciculatus]